MPNLVPDFKRVSNRRKTSNDTGGIVLIPHFCLYLSLSEEITAESVLDFNSFEEKIIATDEAIQLSLFDSLKNMTNLTYTN